MLFGRPWQYDKDTLYHGRTNQYSFLHKEKKIVLHPMSPNDILRDELARASKEKKQRHDESENQFVVKEFVQHMEVKSKYVHEQNDEIKLKGACLFASKSDLHELLDGSTVCYALICIDTLFS